MPTYTVINPATEQPVRTVPSTSAEETDAAIQRAAAAQGSWRATAPGEQAALLRAVGAQGGAHTAIRIGELARAAGLPEGVFQVLPGKGSVVGQRLVDHPLVRKIVFTGSTEVGQQVMRGCAAQIKRLTLELGGKSANVVFADADLEKAAATAPSAV